MFDEHIDAAQTRVLWGMPELFTGLLITVLITVNNSEKLRRENGLLLTSLIMQPIAAHVVLVWDREAHV